MSPSIPPHGRPTQQGQPILVRVSGKKSYIETVEVGYGTTLDSFLQDQGAADNYNVSLSNSEGGLIDPDGEYVLQDGDSVSLSPRKVAGN